MFDLLHPKKKKCENHHKASLLPKFHHKKNHQQNTDDLSKSQEDLDDDLQSMVNEKNSSSGSSPDLLQEEWNKPVHGEEGQEEPESADGLFASIGGDVEDVLHKASGFAKRFSFPGKSKGEESEVEIKDITKIPEDFDVNQETLAEDECYKITLKIIKANNLAALDNNGLSDPFVEIVFHKELVRKSKVINKTVNPMWNESFTLFIDDRSTLVNIQVYDHDLFGANQRIGYVDLDLASIPPFHRYTTTMNLGSSVGGQDNVGTITFSYLVEVVPTEMANEIRSIGTKGQERLLGIIQMTVIEAIDMPPMNNDGSCDPFIRLQLGGQQFDTKVISSTLNPKWKESCEFRYLNTSGDVLQVSAWDSEAGSPDNLIGETEIDISKIAPNKPLKYIFGLDNVNTKISLLIKILKFAELGAVELQLQKEISEAETRILRDNYALVNTVKDITNVGYLIVKLIRATNLPGKRIGSMDPYVVMEIENCRSVSPVRENCVEPEWNLTYRFPVNDYHSILYLTLLDKEDLVTDVVVGRIALPLFNCTGLTKLTLKNSKLSHIGKGELIIETAVFYNPVRAAIRTFSPKEEIILKHPAKFDVKLLQRDVKRITAQVGIVQDFIEGVDQIFRWRSKPLSLVSMIIFVLITYYIELWMVPLALGLLLLSNLLAQRFGFKKKESWVKNSGNRAYYELAKEKTDGAPSSKSFGAKLDKMKTVFTSAEQIQKGLDSAAGIGEKFSHIGQWKVQFISWICTFILIAAAGLLYYVSVRYLVIVWGLNKFRKYYLRPTLVDNNELVDLLSRVPSFTEIDRYRQIRGRMSKRTRAVEDAEKED